jgi:hypothetical protein
MAAYVTSRRERAAVGVLLLLIAIALLLPHIAPGHSPARPERGESAAGEGAPELFRADGRLQVVSVEAIGLFGRTLRRGTGVAVDGSLLVTAGHLARDCVGLKIVGEESFFVGGEAAALALHDVLFVSLPVRAADSTTPIDPTRQRVRDTITRAAASGMVGEPLAVSDPVVVGTGDSLIATRVLRTGDSTLFGDESADLNVLVGPGDSGSPVFTLDGRLAGILVAGSDGHSICASISSTVVERVRQAQWEPLSVVAAGIVTGAEQSLALLQSANDGARQTARGDPDEHVLAFSFAHAMQEEDWAGANTLVRDMARLGAESDIVLTARIALLEMSLADRLADEARFSRGVHRLRGIVPWSALVRHAFANFPPVMEHDMLRSWYREVAEPDWYVAEAAAMAGDRAAVADILCGMDELWWRYPPDVSILSLLGYVHGTGREDDVERKLRQWPFTATNVAASESGRVWRSIRSGSRREWLAANELVEGWHSGDPRRETYRLAQHAMCLWSLGRSAEVSELISTQLEGGWWDEHTPRQFAWLAWRACDPPELAVKALDALDSTNANEVVEFGTLVLAHMDSDEREAWLEAAAAHVSVLPDGSRRQSAAAALAAWRAAR